MTLKLKDLLNEELIGSIKNKYEVYKNPKSIKRMEKNSRAISFPNGDLYVVDDSWNLIHSNIAKWLKIPDFFDNEKTIIKGVEKGYIAWERDNISNIFILGVSNTILPESHYVYIKKYVSKIKQKNPQYKFIADFSYYADMGWQ